MAEGHPSHSDLMRQIEANGHQASELFGRLNTRMAELFQIVENVEASTDRIETRVEKVEAKVLKYDLMGARIVGALGAFGVAVTVLWWLIHDKVEALFGVKG